MIFEKILGLDSKTLDDQETFKYSSQLSEVVSAITQREARLAFILNPTRIEQVQEVASAGLTMPRKSTYFYPKVMTGLVMNPINPEEEILVPQVMWHRPRLLPGQAGRLSTFPAQNPATPLPAGRIMSKLLA